MKKENHIQLIRSIGTCLLFVVLGFPAFAQPTNYSATWGSGGCQGNETLVTEKNWNHSTNWMGSTRNSSNYIDFEFVTTSWKSTGTGGQTLCIIFRHGAGGFYALTHRKSGSHTYRLKESNAANNNNTGQLAFYNAGSAGNRAVRIRCVDDRIQVDINNDGSYEIDYTDPTPLNNPAAINKGFIKRARFNDGCTFANVSWTEVISAVPPTLTTTAHSNVTCTTAESGGTSINNGGGVVNSKGICWGTSANPDTTNKVRSGNGDADFGPLTMTGLTPGQTYFYRAYAANEAGVGYGSDGTFTATSAPVITSTGISSITSCTAAGGGTSINDQGQSITAKGVCWGTSANPDLTNSTDEGSSTSDFASNLTSLAPNTQHYYRAYVTTTECGTFYGGETDFTTNTLAAVTSSAISSLACTGADGGGTGINAQGNTISAKGICWGTSANPDLTNSTDEGTSSADFSSSISGLSANTSYFYRAYVTTECGTGYGSDVAFTSESATVAGTVGSAQSIGYCATPAALTETGAPSAGTGAYTHQWQSSPDDAVWTSIGGETSDGYSPGVLSSSTYYRRQDTSDDCGTANTGSFLITVGPAFDPGIIGF